MSQVDRPKQKLRSLDERLEALLMREHPVRLRVWQALLLILICVGAFILFGVTALKGEEADANAIERAVFTIVDAPRIAHRVVHDAVKRYNPRLARDQRFDGETGLSKAPDATANGAAIVLSRYAGDEKRGVVEILDLDSGAIIHSYRPDIEAINARSVLPKSVINLKRDFGLRRYMEHHPFVLPDGSLIFHGMESPLVKIDACSNVVWTLDGDFSHSIEQGADGNFWTVETLHPPTIPLVDRTFDDDAIAQFSPDGRLLFHKSVAQILIDAGMNYIVYSHERYDEDPVHLNDVQPVISDGPYWKKNDLFISLRNPSMLALYRPSTNKLVWTKQGPWLMQHDVDIISDHEIAVFNNNTAAAPGGGRTIGSNGVIIFDFSTGKTREPFKQAFAANKIHTETNGLFRFLSDGSLMVEEHDYGRLLAMGPDGAVKWSYINRAPKDGRVFHLGWSRALTAEAAASLKTAYAKTDCNSH
jgi:hypothetical protein